MTASHQGRHIAGRTGVFALLVVSAVVVLVPFLWMLRTLFEPNSSLYAVGDDAGLLPTSFTLDHLKAVWDGGVTPFYVFALNSIVITAIVTVSNVLFCGLAGFALARGRFPGRGAIFAMVILLLALPVESRVIPLYAMVAQTPLLDSRAGVALPLLVTSIGIFLMRQYILSIPKEVDEAAVLDGCSSWRLYWRIIFPVCRPAVAVVAVFSAVSAWNDFLWPLIVVTSNNNQTLPLAIANLSSTKQELIWGELMTASFLSLLPVLVLYLFLQRLFVAGLTGGAVKG